MKEIKLKGDYPGVYLIFNIILNKFYIGAAKNIYLRLRVHFNNSDTRQLNLDIEKYDKKWFRTFLLYSTNTHEEAYEIEKSLLCNLHEVFDIGYNKVVYNGVHGQKKYQHRHTDKVQETYYNIKDLLTRDESNMKCPACGDCCRKYFCEHSQKYITL